MILIEQESVRRAVQAELVLLWAHLRRKREIGSGSLVLGDNDSQLVDDFGFADSPEERTCKGIRDYLRRLADEMLGDSSYPVADDVMQQLTRQFADPVLLVAEERSRVSLAELVAEILSICTGGPPR